MTGRQRGIILFNTIMMISLLMVIVLSQMQLIALQFKSVNHFMYRHQLFQRLEAEANRLVLSSNKDGWPIACLIAEMHSEKVLKRLQRSEGCHVRDKTQHYNFFVEDLGFFPCMQVTLKGILYGTRHSRVTILSESMILQLRVAQPVAYAGCEQREKIHIKTGITSWHYMR